MLLRVGSPSVSFGSSLITSGGGQYRLGASLNNLMSAGAMSSGGTNTHAFVTETIGSASGDYADAHHGARAGQFRGAGGVYLDAAGGGRGGAGI